MFASDVSGSGRHVGRLTSLSSLVASMEAQSGFGGRQWILTSYELSSWHAPRLPEDGLPSRGSDLVTAIRQLIETNGDLPLPLYLAVRHLEDTRLIAGWWDRKAWRADYYQGLCLADSQFFDTELQAREHMAESIKLVHHAEIVNLEHEASVTSRLRVDWERWLYTEWLRVIESDLQAERRQIADWTRENAGDLLYEGELPEDDPWDEP